MLFDERYRGTLSLTLAHFKQFHFCRTVYETTISTTCFFPRRVNKRSTILVDRSFSIEVTGLNSPNSLKYCTRPRFVIYDSLATSIYMLSLTMSLDAIQLNLVVHNNYICQGLIRTIMLGLTRL